MKNNFFYKVKKSIFNVEKYPEMATEGVPKAFRYLFEMIAIIAIIYTILALTNLIQIVTKCTNYLQNDCPDFYFKDGIFQFDNKGEVVLAENSILGKIIIDTNQQNKEQINKYTNDLLDESNGLIVLSDKAIIKNQSFVGTNTIEFKDLSEQFQIKEFSKQTIIDYVKSGNINNIYISFFIIGFFYYLLSNFISIIIYVLLISILGYLVSIIIKMVIRYKAVFNMAVYSMTLSNLLLIIYSIINEITGFQIKYFSVMYISVASIYIIATIFILKSDLIKKQAELQKIVDVEKEVKEELEREEEDNKEKENKKEDENENKDTDKENDDKKKEGIEIPPRDDEETPEGA